MGKKEEKTASDCDSVSDSVSFSIRDQAKDTHVHFEKNSAACACLDDGESTSTLSEGDFFDYLSSYWVSLTSYFSRDIHTTANGKSTYSNSHAYRRLLATSHDSYDTYVDKTFNTIEMEEEEEEEERKVYFSRWYVLGVCSLIAFGSGAAYDYGLYSDELKESLDYSETELSLIDSCGNAGLFSMILSGLLLEKVGPKNNILIGGLLAFIGKLKSFELIFNI